MNTESTCDGESEPCVEPLNLQTSQWLKVGLQPISIGIGAPHHAEGPGAGPERGGRFVLQSLLPE